MSPWRLEVLRLWRTRRLVVLASAYLVLGLGIPVAYHYLPALLATTGTRLLALVAFHPTPAEALTGFGQNAAELGTLAVVAVAASGFAVDARSALAAFYRTKARSPFTLLLPRYAVTCVAAALCYGIGSLAAWYETAALIGHPATRTLAEGPGLGAVWICFCATVVALWASLVRTVPATVGASLATLLAIAFVASLADLSSWSPTTIALGVALVAKGHPAVVPWRALALTGGATVTLLGVALWRLPTRKG